MQQLDSDQGKKLRNLLYVNFLVFGRVISLLGERKVEDLNHQIMQQMYHCRSMS